MLMEVIMRVKILIFFKIHLYSYQFQSCYGGTSYQYFGSKLLRLFRALVQIFTVIDHALSGGIYCDHVWTDIHLVE